jgi:cephalosporin hydroxylase
MNPPSISKLALSHYLSRYKKFVVNRYENEPIVLLEIGIAEGASLLYFRDILPKAKIVGLDIKPLPAIDDVSGRIVMYQGDQQDTFLLDRIAHEQAPDGFDVIIDDGSHIGQFTRIAFWHLFKHHLKPGGLYFIEDWGCSYWNSYPDGHHYAQPHPKFALHEKALNAAYRLGTNVNWRLLRKGANFLRTRLVKRRFRSHDYGMVGVLKELIDECGVPDITDARFGKGKPRLSLIEEMSVSVGLAQIVKSKNLAPMLAHL